MAERLTAAQYRAAQNSPPRQRKVRAGTDVAQQPQASPEPAKKPANRRDADTLARQQAAPAVKALFQVARWPGFDGARMVLTGLDNEQVAALRTAAEAAGVSERQAG